MRTLFNTIVLVKLIIIYVLHRTIRMTRGCSVKSMLLSTISTPAIYERLTTSAANVDITLDEDLVIMYGICKRTSFKINCLIKIPYYLYDTNVADWFRCQTTGSSFKTLLRIVLTAAEI